ncbi:MAG TPA: hypothetical protein VMU82_13155 [Acetobacteraceae bacterium]|nr:hypothetical protein [Acetobacteraceae bacterium]
MFEGRDRGDRVIHPAFEQAGDMNEIGREIGQERLTDAFSRTRPPGIARIVPGDGRRHAECADAVLGDEGVERRPQRFHGFGERIVQRDPDIMAVRTAGERGCKRERIAPDSTKAACGLRALQIQNDPHLQDSPGWRVASARFRSR